MKLFRHTRGPYKTSKFGKLISEARDGLLDLLAREPNHPILDPWLSGMARDAQTSSSCNDLEFTRARAIEELRAQKGSLAKLRFWGFRLNV